MKNIKYSIRSRLTLTFLGIMTLMLAIMYGVNTYFLENYYFNEKVEELEAAYNTVDKMVVDADEDGETIISRINQLFGQNYTDSPDITTFRALNDQSNINVVLIDQYDNALISTSREGDWLAKKLRFYLSNKNAIADGEFPNIGLPVNPDSNKQEGLPNDEEFFPETIYEHERYIIQKSFDNRSKTHYLESWGYFSDGKTKFIMSMPVATIHDSVAITNRFLLFVGIIVLIGGGVFIFIASSAVTRPINNLATISERMTKLDFGAKYEGRSQDEIGTLGNSMNVMSEKLEKTIAELKTANNSLKKDINEKTKIDEMRKEFIANVSHELKTPIALIEGYAEGLVEGMAEDKESRDYYCNVIMDEAIKMNKMVKQLTSLNDLEIGKDRTEFSCFDLSELIKSMVETYKLKFEEMNIRAELNFRDGIKVWADEFKIEAVVTNYLTNAINHIGGERRIIISADVKNDEGKEIVFVNVYNDGQCIPEAELDKIWDKFYKVDKARTRAYGGSGIGLSIVKAILESHGQSFGVKNEAEGVSFYFTLESAYNCTH